MREINKIIVHCSATREGENFDVAEIRKIPMIIVEHDMDAIMDIADRALVLDFGSKIAEGTPAEVVENPGVVKAYLGEEDEFETSSE